GKTTLVVKGPGPGLVVTWQIRVIAAGLKISAARLGLPLNRRYALKANFADEAGVVIGPATGVTWASDNSPVAAVAEDGTVSTAGYGHAHVTATAPGGRRAVAEVFVQGEIVVASSRTWRRSARSWPIRRAPPSPPSRPTAPGLRSPRHATGSPRFTSWTRTARAPHGSPTPRGRTATRRSRPTVRRWCTTPSAPAT